MKIHRLITIIVTHEEEFSNAKYGKSHTTPNVLHIPYVKSSPLKHSNKRNKCMKEELLDGTFLFKIDVFSVAVGF